MTGYQNRINWLNEVNPVTKKMRKKKQIIVLLNILIVMLVLMVVLRLGLFLLGEYRESVTSGATFIGLIILTAIVREMASQLPEE